MRIIEVRPSTRFKGACEAFKGPGGSPAFSPPNAKQQAIDYAMQRFGGGIGEIRIYDEADEAMKCTVKIDDDNRYST